jgi:NmrA-like family
LPASDPHIHGIFNVQLPKFGMGASDVPSEERQGKDLIDAAIKHGHVESFVYASVDRRGPERSDTDETYVPHFASKARVEKYLKERVAAAAAAAAKEGDEKGKMKWTILRTVAFMENLTDDFPGKVFATIRKGFEKQKMQPIGPKDVGWFAADALLGNPERYQDRVVSIAGDYLDFEEANAIYKEILGTDMPTTSGLMVKPLRWIMTDLDLMFKWLQDHNAGGDIEECQGGMRVCRISGCG